MSTLPPSRMPGAVPGSHAAVTTAVNMRRARRVGFATIVIREFSRIMRIWGQALVPPVITATLYLISFGNLIGGRIGQMGGFTYLQYIAPGLIMMSVITNSYGNVVSSFFGAKFGRHIEELLVSPLPNWLIVLGYVAGGMLRGLLVGLIVTIIALFFTRLHVEHLFVVIAAVLLTSVVFALGGFVNAVFARNFDQITFVPTFILTPLTRPFFESTAFHDYAMSNISLGRLGEIEDVMGAVVFLASPAASLITGHTLAIDGGWTAR